MLRKDKEAVVEEATRLLAATEALYLSDYRGLTVAELTELRAKLRDGGAALHVLKNTLARRAAAEAGREQIVPLLSGPTAVTFCGDDPVAPAKALVEFMRTHPQLVVRGGAAAGRHDRRRRRAGAVDACRRATCSRPGGRHHGGSADRPGHGAAGHDLGLRPGAAADRRAEDGGRRGLTPPSRRLPIQKRHVPTTR